MKNSAIGCNGTYMPTVSGGSFDPFNPDPAQIKLTDIAHHLSNLCRFGGSTSRFYSVAEHSLMVSYLVSPENAQWALLHDASEAYVVDLPKPIKVKFPAYIELEDGVEKAVIKCFGLNPNKPDEVITADIFALAMEAVFFHRHGVWPKFWQEKFGEMISEIPRWEEIWHRKMTQINTLNTGPQSISVLFAMRAEELGVQRAI